ncbi:hypothetical protein BKA69DRAFT_1066744 [Paraphysoderma sedebokerense]|nr:hypothetical protein BKA69DRAFT_1066744 [Paraphysoderma sedebokerense]
MLDDLADNLVTQSRKLTKEIQEARHDTDDTVLKQLISNFTETIEKYIPVLMQQAKVYWDLQDHSTVEIIFRKSMEFCSEHDTWRLNVAHVLFMQEKYKEAITFYEPIVKKHSDKLLLVPAIVLANLCVSYIMTSQNEEAEELMKRIEKEEERISLEDPVKRTYHLCIVNLIIGTLYCAKGNYEFGIGRVMKSLDPMSKKLGTDTWFYTKRCFCSLFETIAKQMIVLKDSVYYEIMQFLDNVELNGRSIPAVIDPLGLDNIDPTGNYVALEARYLKALFLKLYQ